MKAIKKLLAGKWHSQFEDHTAIGERFASDADQASAKLEYSDAAHKYETAASAYGEAVALTRAPSGIETEAKLGEAKALEQFMLGKSLIDRGRRAEVENKDPSRAYFKAVDHFDAMTRIASEVTSPTPALSRKVAQAGIFREYAAGLGHFAQGRQADEREFPSRLNSFSQAFNSFNKMLETGPDPTGAAGLLPIQKNELVIKRLIAIGEANLADGAIFASDHANSKETGSFLEQAAICKHASTAFNQALAVSGGPSGISDEARSSLARAEKWGGELQDWAEVGAELGTPGKPLRNCREIMRWCATEIGAWDARGRDEARAGDEVVTFAEEASKWQGRAARTDRAHVLLKELLNLPYFPPRLIEEAKGHIARAEPIAQFENAWAENKRDMVEFTKEWGAGKNIFELMRWAHEDDVRSVSSTGSVRSASSQTRAAKEVDADSASSPKVATPSSSLPPVLSATKVAESGTEKGASPKTPLPALAGSQPSLPRAGTPGAYRGPEGGRPSSRVR